MNPRIGGRMSALKEFLGVSRRNFLMIAHRARSDGEIHLNDLCGASGRWDGVARSITSALFLSHDMRRDTSIHILLQGPDDPPKLLSVSGSSVKYLNPDERASSALMKKCLSHGLGDEIGSLVKPSPGITLNRAGLEDVLKAFEGPVYYLHENGTYIEDMKHKIPVDGPLTFVLSDDMDLTDEEEEMVEKRCEASVSLGPEILHTHMAIIIIHHFLDMLHVS
jgi:tRNA (pseudouridine54-N1)-methyltransferase